MKILIIGNSGSGKSTLAKKICNELSIVHHDLDDVYWRRGRYKKSHPHKKIIKISKSLAQKDRWVIEGIYTHLVKAVLCNSNLLIWMDLNKDKCIKNVVSRDINPSSFQLARINGYYYREYGSSYNSHFRIWNEFPGEKYRFFDLVNEIDFIKNNKDFNNDCYS